MKRAPYLFILLLGICVQYSFAQKKEEVKTDKSTFSGLEFRSIGPALMSGRIADIAIDPTNENHWYIGVGSGGVWETKNAGITWKPIFDDKSVFSIGCITIDPNNSNRIWVGTGENVGGRHVGFGDGIYLSENAGKSWTNMGLKESEHLSKIIVHPTNPKVLWVASQGPLWSSGGERGVYMTEDGGKSWNRVLGDDKWIGATDLAIDPRNPNVLYAATWQRHRTVAAYMGGGPGSGLHKSTDGGKTWTQLKSGLPTSNLGKIGLAISPQKPDVLYAAIELDHRKGGLYKSINGGASWSKQSDAISGGTGPHYYQELYASPHAFDRIYLADVRMQVSDDGGKTFRVLNTANKHVDNHALVFKKDEPDYLLVGTDGGLYESFDLAKTWRYFPNLPLTQFYDIAIDDSEPFYNVYGGTQDNNSLVGPSQTDNVSGISNGDWRVFLFADGHQPATEPNNPNVVYGQWQQGNLTRIDMVTGEIKHIQPHPEAGGVAERFNWDAPILVSSHDPKRLYHGSQRLWRSDDRGNKWKALSADLTRNENRVELPIMGRKQSFDNPWDVYAMSNYNTITMIAESAKDENFIMIGTDDGIIQMTEHGGQEWKKIEVGSLPGVPATAYVNDIKIDQYDDNIIYVALDNHKYGDYKPYLLKSTNKGKSWKSIASTVPDRHLCWRLVQDHKDQNLLFLGTELGLFVSTDRGESWAQLKGGLPTISFRDLKIHPKEDDLVVATFGRGIYILDDISPLRHMDINKLTGENTLFPVRDSWWYIQKPKLTFGPSNGSQGDGHFKTSNPTHGATFTYYIADSTVSNKKSRKAIEKKLTKEEKDIPFPGWDKLAKESKEAKVGYFFIVSDENGKEIKKIKAKAGKGFHRTAWDMTMESPRFYADGANAGGSNGNYVAPGRYSAQLFKNDKGQLIPQSSKQSFNLNPLYEPSAPNMSAEDAVLMRDKMQREFTKKAYLDSQLEQIKKKKDKINKAIVNAPISNAALMSKIQNLNDAYFDLNEQFNGNSAKQVIGEKVSPTAAQRLNWANSSMMRTTDGPTDSALEQLKIASQDIAKQKTAVEGLSHDVDAIIKSLRDLAGIVIQ